MAATGIKTPSQTGYDVMQAPRMSPQAMQAWNLMEGGARPGVEQGLGHLSRMAGGDTSYFDQLEAPALRQMSALQGNVASRFSGAGTGARRSSGFANTMSSANQALSESLQSQRLGMQNSAIQQLMGIYGGLIQNDPYEMFAVKKKQKESFWNKIMRGGAPIIGAVGGGIAGNAIPGIGTWKGASIGTDLGNIFGNAFGGDE